MLLNSQQSFEEIKEETAKCLETNENGNTTIPILWEAAQVLQEGRSQQHKLTSDSKENLK